MLRVFIQQTSLGYLTNWQQPSPRGACPQQAPDEHKALD